VQGATRGGKRFGLAGGQSRDGAANQLSYGSLKTTVDPGTPRGEVVSDGTGLTRDGQYVVNYGSSFVMAVELGPKGPRGSAFLTYAESDDPASPHFSDQTALFSDQRWRPIVFAEADIAADPTLRVLEVAGGE
jgi:acyl-homoserine-lactone acylase